MVSLPPCSDISLFGGYTAVRQNIGTGMSARCRRGLFGWLVAEGEYFAYHQELSPPRRGVGEMTTQKSEALAT